MINFVYVFCIVLMLKMEVLHWMVELVLVDQHHQVLVLSYKHYHKEEKAFSIVVTVTLKCHQSQCQEIVQLPVKGTLNFYI